MLCASLDRRGDSGRVDTGICTGASLLCSPEIIVNLLTVVKHC